MHRARQTLADYDALPEKTKAHFIEGELVMEPPPTPWHEQIVMRLVHALADVLGPRWDRRVFVAHLELRAPGEAAQPDVVVLPEGTKATGVDWKAPTPVLVAEVLSPSTASQDRGAKLRFFARAGVREAWIVDPQTRTIEVHDLVGGSSAAAHDVAESQAVPGLRVDIRAFFAV
jgi:Uma2 family endonuclease